jgi:hypothetical protein
MYTRFTTSSRHPLRFILSQSGSSPTRRPPSLLDQRSHRPLQRSPVRHSPPRHRARFRQRSPFSCLSYPPCTSPPLSPTFNFNVRIISPLLLLLYIYDDAEHIRFFIRLGGSFFFRIGAAERTRNCVKSDNDSELRKFLEGTTPDCPSHANDFL